MKVGDRIYTPRFCTVMIEEVFNDRNETNRAGFTEPTHYHKDGWSVAGKSLDMYHMEFAAYKE